MGSRKALSIVDKQEIIRLVEIEKKNTIIRF